MTEIARYFLWRSKLRVKAERVKNPIGFQPCTNGMIPTASLGAFETQENVRWISEHATMLPGPVLSESPRQLS